MTVTRADWLLQGLSDGTQEAVLDCGAAPGPIGVTAVYAPDQCETGSPDVMTVTTSRGGRIHRYALVYVDSFEVDPAQLRQAAADQFRMRPAPPG